MNQLHRSERPDDLIGPSQATTGDDAPSQPESSADLTLRDTTRGPFDARFALAATLGLWVILFGLMATLALLAR